MMFMNCTTQLRILQHNAFLDEMRAKTLRPLVDGLKDIDQELVKGAVAGAHF